MVATLTDDCCIRFITRTLRSLREASRSYHHRRTQRCASRWCINIPAGISLSRQRHARTAKAADARVSTRKSSLMAKNVTSVVDGGFRESRFCVTSRLTGLDMPHGPRGPCMLSRQQITRTVSDPTPFLTRALRTRDEHRRR